MSRYTRTETEIDDSEYYKPIRRGKKILSFHETPKMKNPSASQRATTKTSMHIWKYGDRFYKLANDYYGDVRFWWVIAWWNLRPTESHLKLGDGVRIPGPLEQVMSILKHRRGETGKVY